MLYSLRALAVAAVMAGLLVGRTDGFSGFTYESLRQSSVALNPVPLSDWPLEDGTGKLVSLSDFANEVLLIDFVYTRCPTVCRTLGSRYQQLQRIIDEEGLQNTRLLSISIDPEFDTPKRLTQYRKVHGGASGSWIVARPTDNAILADILAQTGLRVIPDPLWGLAHSDAVHIVSDGRLKRIEAFDSERLESLMRAYDKS